MANRDRRTILSYLENLMKHIIKWNSQEDKRSENWKRVIENSREEISDKQNKRPYLNDKFLKRNAEKLEKTNKQIKVETEKRNWEEIVIEADTMITHELLLALEEGDFEEVKKGLQSYHHTCIQGAKHELWQHLKCLMEDVILAKFSDKYHTQGHWEKISNWRSKVEDDLEYDDFLTKKNIKEEWTNAFRVGKKLAVIFVPEASKLEKLTWNEVFEKSYHPDNYGK